MADLRATLLLLGIIFLHSNNCNNFCFQCESTNGNLPDCDNINSEDTKYEVDCTGGHCTKTTRQANGSVVYVKRDCQQYSTPNTYTCDYVSVEATAYEEIFCACETSYCNESHWLTKLDPTLFLLVLTMGLVVLN